MPRPPSADRICIQPDIIRQSPTRPSTPPIELSAVWQCDSPDQADRMLGGHEFGYVYQRDGHPNADQLAERIAALHGAETAMVHSSGMASLAAALLSQTQHGDHLVVSNQLYGRSSLLLEDEAQRMGIRHTLVDITDLAAVEAAITPQTRMVVVETLANPMLRCANIPELAKLTHAAGALLLVDNTFATPALCQPLRWGADLVMESVSKMMNGHGDVMLGALCGSADLWERVPRVTAAWGLASGPFECWLGARGLATLPLRMQRACENALAVAEALSGPQGGPVVERVDYPGLKTHPDHDLVRELCGGKFGSIVTFRLRGGRTAAEAMIERARSTLPFCPSLGELATTLSHPQSTSHRGLSEPQRQALGIDGGTIRLSCGLEQSNELIDLVWDAIGVSERNPEA